VDEVNPKLPDFGPGKLVVRGILSTNDSLIKIDIYKTLPYFNEKPYSPDDDVVKDAIVTLSNGERKVFLKYHTLNETPSYLEDEEFFRTSSISYTIEAKELPIIPGHTYHLEVTTAEGFHAKARCTVPKLTVMPTMLRIDSTYINGFYRMKVTLEANENNWIRLIALNRYLRAFDYDPTLDLDTIMPSSGTEFFLALHNKEINLPANLYVHQNESRSDIDKTIGIEVHHFDKNFFDEWDRYYSQSRNTKKNPLTQSFDIQKILDLPYSEPSYYYTNIEGGIGFFTATSVAFYPIDIDKLIDEYEASEGN
jgi:hypothetical protein